MDLATEVRSTQQDEVHLARVRLYSPTWPEQTWVMRLCETRYDVLSLIPRCSRPVFVIHRSSKTNSGFFPCVSTASGKIMLG